MISVIIPTYNEEERIATTINSVLKQNNGVELIIADGGSRDQTCEKARSAGASIVLETNKGRARQMNAAAAIARGEILYFLHADSIPPENFTDHILKSVSNGSASGCFRLKFDHDHWFLNASAWFTRFNLNAVRFGDQSLFVKKEIFEACGKFNEELLMMEDQEIISRIKKFGRFEVLKQQIVTSARKYHDNGIFRMQAIFFRIWALYYLGYSQQRMLEVYRKLIRKHKL